MKKTKTQIEESLETYQRKIEEMQTANLIITGVQRWIDTGNDAYLKSIILQAAWLYTRDDTKAWSTTQALDKIKEMSRSEAYHHGKDMSR